MSEPPPWPQKWKEKEEAKAFSPLESFEIIEIEREREIGSEGRRREVEENRLINEERERFFSRPISSDGSSLDFGHL